MAVNFLCIETGISTLAFMFGVEPVHFKHDPTLCVVGLLENYYLDDPTAPMGSVERIRDKIKTQKGFHLDIVAGIDIVFSPHSSEDGYCCYIIGSNGSAKEY